MWPNCILTPSFAFHPRWGIDIYQTRPSLSHACAQKEGSGNQAKLASDDRANVYTYLLALTLVAKFLVEACFMKAKIVMQQSTSITNSESVPALEDAF